MRSGFKLAAGAVAAVAVAAGAALSIGRVASERRITREIEALLAARSDAPPVIVTEADLAPLPEPVRRWLTHAGIIGKVRPATVRLKQVGEFRLGADKNWMPFAAEEYYTTDPPGFIWTVDMRMAPLLTISGRDCYAGGAADIRMSLLSLVPVARSRGEGLNQGAMLRYLNEIMWFPAAAISPSITWEAIDARSARATMTHGGVTASAIFLFDGEGRLTDMQAQRFDSARGTMETWSTPITAYGEFAGVRIPVAGEGVWKYEGGDFAYIRLRITDLEYDRPARY
ncbi:MAG: DUF6544 family protein [Dehalococcoidia bacterium]